MAYTLHIDKRSAEFDGLIEIIRRTENKHGTGNRNELIQYIREEYDIAIGQYDGTGTSVSWRDEQAHFWWTLRWL